MSIRTWIKNWLDGPSPEPVQNNDNVDDDLKTESYGDHFITPANPKDSNEPYIEIISQGMDAMGRIRIEFDWNDAFIKNLRDNGFDGDDEESVVQAWFRAITYDNMNKIIEDDNLAAQAKINPAEHPDL